MKMRKLRTQKSYKIGPWVKLHPRVALTVFCANNRVDKDVGSWQLKTHQLTDVKIFIIFAAVAKDYLSIMKMTEAKNGET
jgi:hypothetical protein